MLHFKICLGWRHAAEPGVWSPVPPFPRAGCTHFALRKRLAKTVMGS